MKRGFAGLLACGLGLLPGLALAGTISLSDNSGFDAYKTGLDQLNALHRANSSSELDKLDANLSGSYWYNPDTDLANMFTRRIATDDPSWARSSLRIYDLYRGLGGNRLNLRQVFRNRGDRSYYVGLDTVGGAWFSTASEAQGYLLKLLISKSLELPSDVRSAVAALNTNDLDTIVQTARDALATQSVFVSQGTETTATLTGSGFSNSGGLPLIKAPAGIEVSNVAYVSDSELTATLKVTQSAETGLALLQVFNVGGSMMPADSFSLFVVAGSGTLAATADDHGDAVATATALATGGSVSGQIGDGSDADLFAITVGSAGTLTLNSTGGTDLKATLETAAGAELATDDDGGTWYNFSFSSAVTAGTYYLRVQHCCGGSGPYSVSAALN